jgi:type IV secretion system protein TrbL
MTSGVSESFDEGQRGGFTATGGTLPDSSNTANATTTVGDGAPGWARKLRHEQRMREGVTVAAHTIRDGDRPASGENPRLKDDD